MCGRFTQKSERKVLQEEFFIQEFTDEIVVSYNVAPGQTAGVIINDGANRYCRFKWGLVPSWAGDPKIGYKMINARLETVAQKPSFKKAFNNRRCIVPVDGFYEWKKSQQYKTPFYIYRNSEKPLGLAGLWEQWNADGEPPLYTFTILTTEADEKLSEIHSRMPVILPEENREKWLTEGLDMNELIKASLGKDLVFHEVSRYVNTPQNNSPKCIQPATLLQ
jgi:putative SOS response-associated peptidase YedK